MFVNCYRDSQKNAIFLEERIVNIPSSAKKIIEIIVGCRRSLHVVIESLLDLGIELLNSYLDKIEKKNNPFGLAFLGDENNFLDQKKS